MSRIAAVLVLAAFAALPAAAQNLKPGLWEMQQKIGGNPQMDQAMAEMQKQLAGMSPAQRKQMEGMMASRGAQVSPGAGGAMAVRVCMTKEMVERNEVPASQGDCKTTQQSRSGNTIKMAFACTKPPTTGESQVTMVSSQAFQSRTTVNTSERGKPEKTTIDATGKWLGADCGSVKPVTPSRN
jgi:hypothetical protein